MSSSTAFLFPGQGSQKPGMAADVVETWPELQSTVDQINEIMGRDLFALMRDGSSEDLKPTEITQPALFAASAVMWQIILKSSPEAAAFAGHSLGEFSAYYASGALSLGDAASLVKRRGELMAASDPEGKGTMASVLKLDDDVVEAICREASKTAIVVPANYNCPGQLVISGEKKGVEAAAELAKAKGGRAIMLPVSGAFHSPLMEAAAGEFADRVRSLGFTEPSASIYSNVLGTSVEADQFADTLIKQLTSPVLWTHTIRNMVDAGVSRFIEVGSGSVLTGLVKRIHPDAKLLTINSADSLRAFLDQKPD